MDLADLDPGQSLILPDGSVVTRWFNGSLRWRGVPPEAEDAQTGNRPARSQPSSTSRE